MKNKKKELPPITEDEVLNVTIVGIGSKGDGIAKVKGFVIMIPHVAIDEEVKVKITKVMSTFAFAEVVI